MTISVPISHKRKVRPGGCRAGERRSRIHTQAGRATSALQPWLCAMLRAADRPGLGRGRGQTAAGTVGDKGLPCSHLPSPRWPSGPGAKGAANKVRKTPVCGVRMVQDADSRFPSPWGHGARGATVPGSAGPILVQTAPAQPASARGCVSQPPSPFMVSEPRSGLHRSVNPTRGGLLTRAGLLSEQVQMASRSSCRTPPLSALKHTRMGHPAALTAPTNQEAGRMAARLPDPSPGVPHLQPHYQLSWVSLIQSSHWQPGQALD